MLNIRDDIQHNFTAVTLPQYIRFFEDHPELIRYVDERMNCDYFTSDGQIVAIQEHFGPETVYQEGRYQIRTDMLVI